MKYASLILSGALLALGCGSDDTSSGAGGSAAQGGNGQGGDGQGGVAQAGSGPGGNGQGGMAQGGNGQGGLAQGGSGQGGMAQGGNGQGGGKAGDLKVSIAQHNFYINCQPIVSADPVIGSVSVSYDNSGGTAPATATVMNTTLKMTQGNQSLDWSFKVNPASGSAGPGQTAMISHMKQSGTGMGSGVAAPCSFCGGQWTLDMSWQVAGDTQNASSGPTAVQCVF